MFFLVSTILTFLALILIPCLFISRRLTVPHSFTNISRSIKTAASRCDEKLGTIEEKEKGESIPNHVAIILDGNRRWAKKKGLGVSEGQEAGSITAVDLTVEFFALGIKTVSLFAFSTENWGRPEDEVNYLMDMYEKLFKSEIPFFQKYEIKISVIGNRTNIPEALLASIKEAEEATKSYEGKHLIVAIDYSGRSDILQACKNLAEKAKNGLIQVEDIDENLIQEELMTKCSQFPNPDLLIRTSGEQRISNYFLWQSAYTELYFPSVLWPDFNKAEYLKALTWYQQRNRRFGRRV